MPYKVEVIADSSGKWVSNQRRLPTFKRAEEYAKDLSSRWSLVEKTRIVYVDDRTGEETPVTEPVEEKTVQQDEVQEGSDG